jgi:hypothetical protein
MPAIGAITASPAEPRHADAIADLEALDTFPSFSRADDFMGQRLRLRQLTVDDMQIRPAHRADIHADQKLPGARFWSRKIG